MKNILFILFFSIINVGFLSNNSTIFTKNPSLVTGEIALQYSKSITPVDLKTHLYTMASDEFEGRLTGESGQKMAAEYIKDFYVSHKIASPLGGDDYFQIIPTKDLRPNLKPSENVVAYIKGSEKPEEIIVISAHYDHLGKTEEDIFNGADDNGSGTVAILKIAEAFQNATLNGNGPKRSILFLHFTGEEKGLLGSKYYVNHPVFPLENTVADLNIDMIGRVDEAHKDTPEFVYLIGSDKLSVELHEISEAINSQFTNLMLDYTYNDDNDPNRFYYRSDHYNFAKNNIPIIFYFNGTHDDYHKVSDTPDKINYDILTKRTQLVFFTAWELANRDERIIVD
jgi:Zn-dependent M28 family amino/carboxypeptidase